MGHKVSYCEFLGGVVLVLFGVELDSWVGGCGFGGSRTTVSLLVGVAGPGFLVSGARSWGGQGSGGSYSSWPLVGGAPSLLCLPDSLWFLLYIFSCRRSFLLV